MNRITTEEYLETIGSLQESENPVSTSSIAQAMGISQASVSEMLGRLVKKGLVEHVPYGGASLTEDGFQQYLRLTRRHRLWEVFLNNYLAIDWADVYEHACGLEHSTTDVLADGLAEFMNHPKVCPHGCPIPGPGLEHTVQSGSTLASLEPGKAAVVSSVILERDSAFLRHLSSLGLVPGTQVKIVDKAEFDGTLSIEIAGEMKAIGKDASSLVMVRPL